MKDTTIKKIIIYGEHKKAIQAMLDYDFILDKTSPSICAIIGTSTKTQVYKWGSENIVIPTAISLKEYLDVEKVWGLVIMVSSRNVLKVIEEVIDTPIKNIFILAENVPERDARIIRALAKENGMMVIGPASVGVLYAGDIKISHAGGLIENVIREKLFVKGDVGIVSKSGGMLNELMSIVTRSGAYVHTAIAVGGDRFPITRLSEAVEKLSEDSTIRNILVLGETGGTQENELAELLKTKKVKQKVIVHILGASSNQFDNTIQFGHAGAMAGNDEEKPDYKMERLKEAGAQVVRDFAKLEAILKEGYSKQSTEKGILINTTKMNTDKDPKHTIPKDFSEALASGEVRYTPNIITGVNFDYHTAKDKALGQLIFKLWFGFNVDEKVSGYVELIMKMLADHGAAVSGAHNTIVATRAGKDMVSSVASGILTIGSRFGGAINSSAQYVSNAIADGVTPENFVSTMKAKNIIIPGIGHRLYSVTNNDPRVIELLTYARKNFISHTNLEYFKKVEVLTLAKRDNLIINIDGCIAMTLLDIFEDLKISKDIVNKLLEAESLNGIFILARSIGLIAHHIDQVKLGEGLYRHPEYDIFTVNETKDNQS